MAATTLALAPYQAPPGLSKAEALAHAQDHINTLKGHIGKITKRHESTLQSFQAGAGKVVDVTKRQVGWITNAGFAAGTASALGYMDGRYGGEKGFVEKYGISLGAATAVLAHLGAAALSLKETGDATQDEHLRFVVDAMHTVGDAAIGASMYRVTHAKGVDAARRAGAPAAAPSVQPNGAAPGARGTVYSVAK